VPVHLYGQTAEMEPILAFAREHGLRVIEDAAQAHGAEYRGRRAGTLADAAAFSFYPTKNLGALGDGGAVVTDDPELAERARLLRHYGEARQYESVLAGGNSRLDTLQAAVLAVGLRHLDAWTARRRELAALYREALAGLELVLPEELPGRHHVFHLYVVRAPGREQLRERPGVEDVVSRGPAASRGRDGELHVPEPPHRVGVRRGDELYAGLDRAPRVFPREVEPVGEAVDLERDAVLEGDGEHLVQIERVRWTVVDDAPLGVAQAADGRMPHRLRHLPRELPAWLPLAGVQAELDPVELREHVVRQVEPSVPSDVDLDPAQHAERSQLIVSRPRSRRPDDAPRPHPARGPP